MTRSSSTSGVGPEQGSSATLRRWLDVLRDAGPAGPAGHAPRAPSASSTDVAAAGDATRSSGGSPVGSRCATQDLARLLGAQGAASRLAPAALGAHAAVGELDVQRGTFAALERALTEGTRALRGPIAGLDAIIAGAPGRADADSAATRDEVEPRAAGLVRAGAGALSRAADQLDSLRLQSQATVRATAAHVDALSQEVASADRRTRMQARQQDRIDTGRWDTRAALVRRDAAARELVRLTGATVHVVEPARSGDDGSAGSARSAAKRTAGSEPGEAPGRSGALRIMLGDRALVDEAGAHPLVLRTATPPAEAPENQSAVGTPGSGAPEASGSEASAAQVDAQVTATSGVLAGRLAAADRIIPAAQDRVRSAWDAYVATVTALGAPGGPLEGQDAFALVGQLLSSVPRSTDAGPAVSPGALFSQARGGTSTGSQPGSAQVGAQMSAEPTAPPLQLTDVLAAVEAARADVGERALLAQRRLDVLSVVDSVLAGVPATQAGALVSAALGGGPAALGAWQTSHSGQHLVSSLQSLNALFASLGAVAGLSAVLGPTPPTVRTSGSSVVVATPSASALDSLRGTGGSVIGSMAGTLGGSPLGSGTVAQTDGQGGVGAGDGLWVTGPGVRVSLVKTASGSADANRAPVPGGLNPSAVANTAGGSIPPQGSGVASTPEVATGPAAPWQAPRIPYDVSLTVVSVAARAVVASAGLPTGMVLNAGRGFSFALLTHAGGQTQATTSISVGPGARLSTLAAAINASSAPVYAQVEGFGAGSQAPEERLVLFATETGADTDITIVDGLGSRRPSALGAIAHLRSGADSIVDAVLGDGSVVRVASATTSLPGALPGVNIALRAGDALISAEPQPDATLTAGVSVRPDTPAAARHLSVFVCAAAAVLDGLAGRGPIDVAAARALAQDPAIADLSARIAAVVGGPPAAGAGGVSANATPGGATAAAVGLPGAFAERPLGPPLPGVHVDRHGRLQVDEEAFLLAHGMAPVDVESRMHTAARELLTVAREASDPRTGVLPVRIMGESAFVQEYGVTQANVDERMQYRQDALTDRVEAMQSLLDHLGAERVWLGSQV